MKEDLIASLTRLASDAFTKLENLPLDAILQKASDIFEEISTGLPRKEFTLQDLTEIFSEPLDTAMRKAAEQGYTPAGGMFTVRYIDANHYGLSYDLYMKDAEGKWSKCSGESPALDAVCLRDEVMAELKQKGNVTFEIDSPLADLRKGGN